MPSLDEIAASFDARAPRYARNAWHRRSAERLVELAGVPARARVLDAATGTGFAALAAARDGARVVGIDVSAGMLEQARRAADEAGLADRIELVRGDATRLDGVADASFDVVLCATGLLYMDHAAALREWRRVTRPRGRVAFSAAAADSPLSARLFREAAASLGVALPDPAAPLGTPRRCRAALAAAGWTPDAVVVERVRFTDEDLALAWESNLASAAHAPVRELGAGELATLRARFDEAMAAEDPEALGVATILYAFGTRPAAEP